MCLVTEFEAHILAGWGDADLGDTNLAKDLGTHAKKTLKDFQWDEISGIRFFRTNAVEG